ncbi:MAG: hypothetical protein ACI80V_002424 [Rhodothermales bacterium]|jgi:hypothetical protein
MRALFLVATFLASTGSAAQPTAKGLFDRMVSSFEERSQGIDNYTIVTDAFTSHYRRVVGSGGTRFEVATKVATMGVGNMTTRFSLDNPYRLREMHSAGAALIGPSDLEGVPVIAVKLTPPTGPDADVEAMQLYVDPDLLVVRGLDIESRGPDGLARIEIRFEDFRESDGLLYPWTSRATIHSPGAGVDQENLDRAREAMEEMEDRLAEMPAAQQEMIRARMTESLRRIEEMSAGEGISTVFTVSEVRVNAGIPDGVFN